MKRFVSRNRSSRNNPVVPSRVQSWAGTGTTWPNSWAPPAARQSPRQISARTSRWFKARRNCRGNGGMWPARRTTCGTLLLRQKSRSNEGRELLRESRGQLETLTKEFPAIPQYQQDLAFVLRNLGLAAKLAGQPAEALIDLQAALRIRKKLADDAPGFPEHRMDLAVEAGEVANLLAASDPAAAETVARDALARVAKLADHQPPIPSYVDSVGRAHYEMAQLLIKIKKLDDARSAIEQSVRYHRQALDPRPENFQYRFNLWAASACHR